MTFVPHDHPDFLDRIDAATMDRDGRPKGREMVFTCPNPGHPDAHPSAYWNRDKGTWNCRGCAYHDEIGGGALALAGALGVKTPAPRGRGGGGVYPPKHKRTSATVPGPSSAGCPLAVYAGAKRLPVDFLRSVGLTEITYQGAPAVRIPYRLPDGQDGPTRYRVRLDKGDAGDDRFRWKTASKAIPYGLDRLDLARERGYLVIVEGESDAQTLWCHGEPALGLPGAGTWNETRDAPHLDGIATVYVVIEPDTGGAAVTKWVATSAIRDRVRLIDLGSHKDPSDLYLDDPDRFPERWRAALDGATAWTERAAREAEAEAADAWETCRDLAGEPDILATVAATLQAAGVAGEGRALKLLYLIVSSRFLPRPVSAAVKGPSSGGKSYTLEQVLSLFPGDAYYALSAMSDRALAYGTEPLSHRFLVIYEAAGMASEMASYLMRSLLSEGRVRYETVEKTTEGMKPRMIEREGPTGLLVTTTAIHLHPENETRLLSLTITDTREQTRDIFLALAGDARPDLDTATWHALQTWLRHGEHRVVIPFAPVLAGLVPPVAVRLRRDFGTLLALIRAHATLHRASRERDDAGRIVATVADYAAVRELVRDLIAEGVEATVPPTVRETVASVRAIVGDGVTGDDDEPTCSYASIAKDLKLDKSAVSRRVRDAIERGYLNNIETRRRQPAKIALGDPLPDDVPILPEPGALADWCAGAGETGGVQTPSPPDGTDDATGDDDPFPYPGDPHPEDGNGAPEPLHDDDGPACFDCGGPSPSDGMHWCLACRAASQQGAA